MYIVDRVENNIVVLNGLDGEHQINVKLEKLNFIVKEGLVIELVENEYIPNYKLTKEREKYVEELTKNIWQ